MHFEGCVSQYNVPLLEDAVSISKGISPIINALLNLSS